MDIRQVALGAAFGAAVAVNAALQSLQDAGSFLIHTPGSRRSPLDILGATSDVRKRPLSVDVDEDDFLDFTNVGDEDELSFSTLEENDIPRSPRTSSELEADEFLKGNDEQNANKEDCELQQSADLENSSKRRKIQGPQVFMPLLTPLVQSEAAMSLMLQHTSDTVLNTLADAKGRRERMLNEMSRAHLPEKENSLKLVNSFIDALVNVSDSLKTVQSALFVRKDELA